MTVVLNYLDPGLSPSSGIQKLDLSQSSGEGGNTPTILGPLERANLNHWTILRDPTEYVSFSLRLRMETDPVS
jgi:hypothetical protein